jgi:hypothetical protein
MRTIWIILVVLAAATGVACKKKKDVTPTEVLAPKFPSIENQVQIQDPASINYKGKIDNFEILDVHTQNQFVIIKVAYSGGCAEHFFEASWDGNFMKSMPPQANLLLTHVNNDDNCRARIERELAIDTHKLFEKQDGQVVLIINGNRNKIITINNPE